MINQTLLKHSLHFATALSLLGLFTTGAQAQAVTPGIKICDECEGTADSNASSYFDTQTFATIGVSISASANSGVCGAQAYLGPEEVWILIDDCETQAGCDAAVTWSWSGLPVGTNANPTLDVTFDGVNFERTGAGAQETDPGCGCGFGSHNLNDVTECGDQSTFRLTLGQASASATVTCTTCVGY